MPIIEGIDMANPNNCSTCDYKQHPDDGHCYMFRDEPQDVCMQHTARKRAFFSFVQLVSDTNAHEPPRTTSSDAEHH